MKSLVPDTVSLMFHVKITSFEGIQSRLDVESQPTLIGKRTKRIPITYEYRYMPVYAFCRCPRKEGNSECLPFFDAQPRDKDSQCVCFYDRVTQTPFRCFPVTFWSLRWCTRCEIAGNCPPADINKLEEDAAGNVDDAYKYIAPCVCQNVTNYCIATGDKPFGRLWLISTAKPPPIAPFVAETTTVQPTTYGPRATTEYPLIEVQYATDTCDSTSDNVVVYRNLPKMLARKVPKPRRACCSRRRACLMRK